MVILRHEDVTRTFDVTFRLVSIHLFVVNKSFYQVSNHFQGLAFQVCHSHKVLAKEKVPGKILAYLRELYGNSKLEKPNLENEIDNLVSSTGLIM